MTELPLADELAVVFARMSQLLLTEQTVTSTLKLITTAAAETLGGTAGAGVTLVDSAGKRTSAAATTTRVEQLDRLQYDLDEGPCLTALTERQVMRIDDMTRPVRWRRWAAAAVGTDGVRSTLSAPLIAGDQGIGAMKLYADEPEAYDERSEHLLSLFASQAAVLVANAQAYQRAREVSQSLQIALRTRDLIGQAKGILMEREHVDGETAFALLSSASQQQHVKLHVVAQGLVDAASRWRP